MMAVAALRTNCQRQRVCDASLLSEFVCKGMQAVPPTQSFGKHACVLKLVSYTAS